MNASDTLDKANPLKPAEDYNKLRREGIEHIEKLAGNVWTDFNTHDPGITLLEALCYAITDLAYRTGFEMKDLLAQKTLDPTAWKNIFYTAREILPCNPLTINDYRKLIIDIKGVRNAWIYVSKDCETPLFINKTVIAAKFNDINTAQTTNPVSNGPCGCPDKIKLPHEDSVNPTIKGLEFEVSSTAGDICEIIELNGLYKIIVEYDEEISENKKEHVVQNEILQTLYRNRNVCEDYLTVTEVEYRDFFLYTEITIAEYADPEMVLAEICYRITNYFTPPIKFYSLEEMVEMGKSGDEIFDGPALDHGFLLDDELEKTNIFRDMRLSDIISEISDIDGITSLPKFMIHDLIEGEDGLRDSDDPCGPEDFFDEWISEMKNEKLVGRLSIDDLLKAIKQDPKDPASPKSYIIIKKPSGAVAIDADRFEKLLNDLKGRDKYLKLEGFTNDFAVPMGEGMELDSFYPVQYELPFTYRVGESGLPLRDGKDRLIQSLQLKGYLAVFEQLFLNYMNQLGSMNEIFSFNDIKFKGKSKHKNEISPCDTDPKMLEEYKPPPSSNQIIYEDEENKLQEKIIGYLCLFYDSEKYLKELPGIIEHETEFETHRNKMLDHLLARFGEEMNEFYDLMKFMYPQDYLIRIIKNKTELLSDYPAISNNRARAYNYNLNEECVDYENKTWDEEEIEQNISGLEKRIARLIGLTDYKRKDIAPYNLFVEGVTNEDGILTEEVKIVLYEDETKKKWLLETDPMEAKCTDEIMHCFIERGCCSDNIKMVPEEREYHHRQHRNPNRKEYSFVLKDEDGSDLATSPEYPTPELRNAAMQKAKCFLEKICHIEGFHMIEHILLRPKGDSSVEDETATPNPTSFELLDICLDRCDLKLDSKKATDTIKFRFDISVLRAKDCHDGKRWNVKLVEINSGETIIEDQFKDYECAADFISEIREYGSELENYVIYKSKKNNKFYFELNYENGDLLVESSCFNFFSKKIPPEEEKANPGTRIECKLLTQEEDYNVDGLGIKETIDDLKKFLAYELDLYCCEEPCDHNEDPYSFRLTFVLPCWSKRFRNKGFRKFVEKTIYAETPAHIQANIWWLGIEQMQDYEAAYFDWLVEMACNPVPDIGICNDFIKEVKKLKHCNDPCEENKAEEVAPAAETEMMVKSMSAGKKPATAKQVKEKVKAAPAPNEKSSAPQIEKTKKSVSATKKKKK